MLVSTSNFKFIFRFLTRSFQFLFFVQITLVGCLSTKFRTDLIYPDYPICVWAVHRLGCIVRLDFSANKVLVSYFCSPINPAFGVEELTYQLQITNAAAILVYSDSYAIAVSAAEAVGISKDRIALIQGSSTPKGFFTVQDLVELGSISKQAYSEPRLRHGEAKTRIAFLSFSSGTTGKFLSQHMAINNLAPIGKPKVFSSPREGAIQ